MQSVMAQRSEPFSPRRAAVQRVCVPEPPFLSEEVCDQAFRWKRRGELNSRTSCTGAQVGAQGAGAGHTRPCKAACSRGHLSPSCPGLRSPTTLPCPVQADKLALGDLSYPSLVPRGFSWLEELHFQTLQCPNPSRTYDLI